MRTMLVKIAALLLAVIASPMLANASAASNPAPEQNFANASSEIARETVPVEAVKTATSPASVRQRGWRPSNLNRMHSYASVATSHRSGKVPNSQQRLTAGTPPVLPHPGLRKPTVVARRGLTQNKSVASGLAVRSSSQFPSSPPSLDNARHRGPNPAKISGSLSLKASNTGVINGSRISRKP